MSFSTLIYVDLLNLMQCRNSYVFNFLYIYHYVDIVFLLDFYKLLLNREDTVFSCF